MSHVCGLPPGFFAVLLICVLFRALKAGMQRPLLVCPPHKDYKNNTLVAALGALHALYMVREDTLFTLSVSWMLQLQVDSFKRKLH